MSTSRLGGRMRLSIELALTAGRHDPELRLRQDTQARLFGMSGAEIDAARKGRSFDVQTSRALAFALAKDCSEREGQRQRTMQAGIDWQTCREIEELAATLTGP